jgi:type VI secretion system protein ImpG
VRVDTRLLNAYERELAYVRDLGAEFAAEHPQAAELGLKVAGPRDPYVERLLEGFAFLAARTQLKLDARHPEFTQHLLELAYPGFLAPVPACAIAELIPEGKDSALASGVTVHRGSGLRANLTRGERTECQFRTAHAVTLWPLAIQEVGYVVGSGALAGHGIRNVAGARAALRIRMSVPAGVQLSALALDSLTFFISCEGSIAARLQEQVLANCVAAYARSGSTPGPCVDLGPSAVTLVGCEEDEALLPQSRPGLQGYRLLQEYFAFPERLRFFRIGGLRPALQQISGGELVCLLVFDRVTPELENVLDPDSLKLYCTPVVNLFPLSLDRVHVTAETAEMLVTADRNRPMDFEIHSLSRVRAISAAGEVLSEVAPLHMRRHTMDPADSPVYYSMQRRPRLRSLRQKQVGTRAKYLGSELYISVTDARQRFLNGELRQLDIEALCTNRDLTLLLELGTADSHFHLEGSAPLQRIRCIAGPCVPRDSPAFGDTAWRLISHLSLNYLSLIDKDPTTGASTLRSLLELYADPLNPVVGRQIAGVRSVRYKPSIRRIPGGGPIAYGRGLEISLTIDDAAFEGMGIIALGAVLEQFFARYASLNSFTQLRLESLSRGEIKRWPPRIGRRQIL